MYQDDITPREILFGIIIFAVMLVIGFFIHSMIDTNIHNQNKEYRQALHICEESMFDYCLNTNVGKSFVEGTLFSEETIFCDKVPDKQFLKLRIVHEEYTKHIETYYDSETKTYKHREYWTWDYKGENNQSVENVNFCGKTFSSSIFDVGYKNYGTYSTGYHKRDIVSGVENNTYGTIYTEIINNTISKGNFYQGCSTEKALDSVINASSFVLPAFWVIWIILSFVITIGFCLLENDWLE